MCVRFLSPFFPTFSVSQAHQAGPSAFVPWQGFGVRECLGPEGSELSWLEQRHWVEGRAGWEPWPAEAGSEASAVAAVRPLKKQTGARECERSRVKTASEETASQMENKFREQEATDQNGKPPEWKRKRNQDRNATVNLKLKHSLLPFFPCLRYISVDLRASVTWTE